MISRLKSTEAVEKRAMEPLERPVDGLARMA
jgi:hypothetical protein